MIESLRVGASSFANYGAPINALNELSRVVKPVELANEAVTSCDKFIVDRLDI